MKLWYTKEALEWESALPIGNGHLGAMVYGGVAKEQLSLNEETLWSGYPRDKHSIDTLTHIEKIRELISDHKNLEAQDLIEQHCLGDWGESYLPLGDLFIEFLGDLTEVTHYTRELTLKDATVRSSFKTSQGLYEREAFVAYQGDTLVYTYRGPKKGLDIKLTLSSQLVHEVIYSTSGAVLSGTAPSHVEPNYVDSPNPIEYESGKGMGFCADVSVFVTDGDVSSSHDGVIITAATEVICVLRAKTGYRGYAAMPDQTVTLPQVQGFPLEETYKKHCASWDALFSRVSLNIGEQEDIPTDMLIEQVESGEKSSAYLIELLFHYGRYLFMSSSGTYGEPANLQGIWNNLLRAPWSANWTVNINTQMNYWMSEVLQLTECNEPLFQLIEDISTQGCETAKKLYNAEGWVSHHNVDLWRQTTPVGKHEHNIRPTQYALWPMSGVWLCQHLMEHYRFTGNTDFLRDTAYPIIEGATKFLLSWMIQHKSGSWITSPSTSPENSFVLHNEPCSVSEGSTMDLALIREHFNIYLTLRNILELPDDSYSKRVKERLLHIPDYQIGERGNLQEWLYDYQDYEPDHRHISFLIGVYPGKDLLDMKDDSLLAGVKRSLELRGDEGVGWSLIWKTALWARLKDGDRALNLLKNQIRPVGDRSLRYSHGGGLYDNLFCAHPPFQIDSNLGLPAAVAELLVQSYGDKITILPALPQEWKNGEVTGFMARGGFELSFSWKDGILHKVTVISKLGNPLCIGFSHALTLQGESLGDHKEAKNHWTLSTHKETCYYFV